jgi:hypothetical protein
MTKRNLLPILLVMILLILLTTRSVHSAAGSGLPERETEDNHLDQDSDTAARLEGESDRSSTHRQFVGSGGGGSVYLIK